MARRRRSTRAAPCFDTNARAGRVGETTGVHRFVDDLAAELGRSPRLFGPVVDELSTVPGAVDDSCDVDADMWEATFLDLNCKVSPWHAVTDQGRWDSAVGRRGRPSPP